MRETSNSQGTPTCNSMAEPRDSSRQLPEDLPMVRSYSEGKLGLGWVVKQSCPNMSSLVRTIATSSKGMLRLDIVSRRSSYDGKTTSYKEHSLGSKGERLGFNEPIEGVTKSIVGTRSKEGEHERSGSFSLETDSMR